MKKQITVFMPETDEMVPVPVKWEICSCCQGHGKSSAYLGAYTSDDMDDMDDDFIQDYIDGRYDRRCDECEGSGKVEAADVARMPPDMLTAWRDQEREDAAMRAEERMERMMGA